MATPVSSEIKNSDLLVKAFENYDITVMKMNNTFLFKASDVAKVLDLSLIHI